MQFSEVMQTEANLIENLPASFTHVVQKSGPEVLSECMWSATIFGHLGSKNQRKANIDYWCWLISFLVSCMRNEQKRSQALFYLSCLLQN